MAAPLLEEVIQALQRGKLGESTDSPGTLSTQNLGSLCQTKLLYESRRKCSCCIDWVEQYPEDATESAEETSDAKRYAILCRLKKAHGNSKKALELHSIVIQSPILKSVLGEVFAGYPGITTTLEDVTFLAPFWEFFYRWKELTESEHDHNSKDSEHIRLLLDTLSFQRGDVHRTAQDLVENNVITFDYLWTLFPPGALVYSSLYDQDCLLEVESTTYYKSTETYDLRCKYIEWSGVDFGWKKKTIEIPQFSGTQPIQNLKAYPITNHISPERIQSKLLERGAKFVSLRGWHHKAYQGLIRVSGESFFGSDKFHINERVIVDAEAFTKHMYLPSSLSPLVESGSNKKLQDKEDFSDRLLMLCSPVVKAYGLKTKCWSQAYVDGISDIEWDENAFRSLVLAEETKHLIESFVLAQMKQDRPAFDDIIEGKGQGMVLLLTGEPGVGKTLTAETVAERARRPLYMVSAGELGTSSYKVEQGLTKILDLAYRWNAVLLLDESDVFLEQRTSANLERNQLVSVFLRMLEYYRGMLFLTTNRLSAFDSAFQSRIHLTLHYQGLDFTSRRSIWEVLLKRAAMDPLLKEEDLVTIAKEPINGRQIKNTVNSSLLLAAAEGVPLSANHINVVLRIMREGGSLGPTVTTHSDVPRSRSKRVRDSYLRIVSETTVSLRSRQPFRGFFEKV